MPFNRPTLSDLVTTAETDFETRLPGADARVPNSNLNVLARVIAGGLWGLYGYLAWIARQALIETCDAEFLDARAAIWGVVRKPAIAAEGDATLAGTNGAIVPAGTVIRRGDGVEYETLAEAVIAAGVATVAVRAREAGIDGNAATGVKLGFVSPIAGVTSEATAAAPGLAGGINEEIDASLRSRLLARIQDPPHGGAAFDYVAWVRETPGVTVATRGSDSDDAMVWVYPLEQGLGTVVARFMVEGEDGFPRVPTTEEIEAVQEYVDEKRPVTAEVFVLAPIANPIDLEIQLLPNSAAIRAQVTAELQDLLRREAEPGDGDGSGTILISHIREAISTAAGESDHVLSDPTADFECDLGEIATLGDITWL